VDFEANEEQRAIVEAVESLLEKHAGAKRAIALASRAEVDADLDAALTDAGFLEIAIAAETGPLEATLMIEAVGRAGGVVSIGASALVAPMLTGRALPGPIALALVGEKGAVRFGAHARTLILDTGDEARVVSVEAGDVEPLKSNFGYPMGRIAVDANRGDSLGKGSGNILRRWWRVAVAAEAVGAMSAAMDVTLEYVKRRRQFGRAIGSFQGIQHRLAECAVLLEGSRWLTREAASKGAPDEAAATAAAHATSAAGRVFAETHQFSGAMGFTREHDLHVWSMRLQALRLEAGGVAGHRRAVTAARWASSTRASTSPIAPS
jgi:alkylation response protein AidB-like acyl-CoA dehydrogenase